jgi:hypothetical protein
MKLIELSDVKLLNYGIKILFGVIKHMDLLHIRILLI